jgi:uncharacterized cupredoxin-like copper-binding protein
LRSGTEAEIDRMIEIDMTEMSFAPARIEVSDGETIRFITKPPECEAGSRFHRSPNVGTKPSRQLKCVQGARLAHIAHSPTSEPRTP